MPCGGSRACPEYVEGFNSSKVQGKINLRGSLHVLRIPETSKHLTIFAAAKESPNLVVVAEERDEKLGASILKDESEIAVAAAFEELAS